jgi:hypothetical protein
MYEFYYERTELRGRVVNTPASYSEGPRFKSWSGDRLIWQVFGGFPQSLQANAEI